MAAREGGGKGGVKEGEAMMANKIATFVGSVPAVLIVNVIGNLPRFVRR